MNEEIEKAIEELEKAVVNYYRAVVDRTLATCELDTEKAIGEVAGAAIVRTFAQQRLRSAIMKEIEKRARDLARELPAQDRALREIERQSQ